MKNTELDKDFSGTISRAWYSFLNDIFDLFKIKNVCSAKDNVKRMEGQKIFAEHVTDTGLNI